MKKAKKKKRTEEKDTKKTEDILAKEIKMANIIVPPNSLELEKEALGMMVISNDALLLGVMSLSEDIFYGKAHQIIFSCLESLSYRNDVDVDIVSLREELISRKSLDDVGGNMYVASLAIDVASAANVKLVIKKLQELHQQRQILSLSIQLNQSISSGASIQDVLADMDIAVSKILHGKQQNKGVKVGERVDKTVETIEADLDNTRMPGISSGFMKLDNRHNGFRGGDLVFVAARPGMGKTSLALNFALAAAQEDENVMIISMEMSDNQLISRMIGQIAKINMQSRYEKMQKFADFTKAADWLRESPIWISESQSLTIFDIKNIIKYHVKKDGLDMVIIDYLQLIRPPKESSRLKRMEQISEITRELKIMAMEFGLPIICLSQLSREVERRAIQRPILSDLRDSGTIEQDADMVLFIYRPEYYKGDNTVESERGIAEIDFAKNRNGSTGIVHLGFKPETCNFYNLE